MKRAAWPGAWLLGIALSSCATAAPPPPASTRLSWKPHRELVPAELLPAIDRASRIGRLLYEVDHAADLGTAFLAQEIAESERRDLAGSATTLGPTDATHPGQSFVSAFLTKETPARVAYRVHMAAGRKPTVEKLAPPAPIDEALLAQFRARETVMARMPKWNGTMKAVVLPGELAGAPASLVVYALREDVTPDQLSLGMHYRAFVTRDGRTLESIEALSDVTALVRVHDDGIPALTRFRLGHPSEADVFVSLSHADTPIAFLSRRFYWLVLGASIGLITKEAPDPNDVSTTFHDLDDHAARSGMPASELPTTPR